MENLEQMVRFKLIFISLFFCSISYGQADTLNQVDTEGKKQGYWIIYGADKPDKGFCATCKYEEGVYKDNRKNGAWIKYYPSGTNRLKGTYKNNRPEGAYTKYYQSGCVMTIGNFYNSDRNGNRDNFLDDCDLKKSEFGTKKPRTDIDGNVIQKNIKDLEPIDTIVYYYPDSTIEFTAYRVGQALMAYRYYPCGELKTILRYDSTGAIQGREDFEPSDDCIKKLDKGSGNGGPRGDFGHLKKGNIFQQNGYNKLYNKDDELWMDGEFKSGKLYNGKLYKYDSDGILTKLEIWKNGKYHSDGQL